MRVLTPEAEEDRASFNYAYFLGHGCTCGVTHAPCSWCTHPGNPQNQDEDENAWRTLTQEEIKEITRDMRLRKYARKQLLVFGE